jgi:acetyl-CoA C-acetyltransferase
MSVPLAGQGMDHTTNIQGSGKLPAGWNARFDQPNGSLTQVDVRQAGTALAFRSGPAALYWNTRAVATGDREVVVAGGMESMSGAPYLLPKARTGARMGAFEVVDSMINDGLVDAYSHQHMGECAELCAREKGITREAQDAYAAESYRRALAAQKNGHFQAEIVSVTVAGKAGDTAVDSDEEPGRGNIDKLPKLRPAFQKEGTVTAGNASSINDGAAAVVLMSRAEAEKRGLPILARIAAHGHHAQAPEWFTTAPAPAIANACRKAGWDPQEGDPWELNEEVPVGPAVTNNALDRAAAPGPIPCGAL